MMEGPWCRFRREARPRERHRHRRGKCLTRNGRLEKRTSRARLDMSVSAQADIANTLGGPAEREAGVPTANPNPLTPIANRLILAPDERSLRIDLVRLDRTVQVAGCVGSRDPGRSTPTQRAAAQIPEAIGVRQY